MDVYANTLEHLLAEMERIDLLLRSQVIRARQVNATDERFQGLYISEEELDRLLATPVGVPSWASTVQERNPRSLKALATLEQTISDTVAESRARGTDLRLLRLTELCNLDAFEVDCLLVCLAPELDLRYERIYAYLQDDVTKKRPSVDLTLSLISHSPHAKLAGRHRFTDDAPLVRYRLLELVDDPSQVRPPVLARYLKIDDRVVSYLLGSDALDGRIRPYTRLVTPTLELDHLPLDSETQSRLRAFLQARNDGEPTILYLQGPYGTGKRSVGEALCREAGCLLLVADLEHLLTAGDEFFRTALSLLHREALLQGGALLFKGFDQLLADGKKPLLDELLRSLEQQRGLAFLAGNVPWDPSDVLRGTAFMRVEMPGLPASRRAELWSTALAANQDAGGSLDVQALAARFRFTAGQIRDAADTARNLARWRTSGTQAVTMPDVYQACRLHSNQKLGALARKINPRHGWDDIVLPANRLEQLRDICNYVKYRERVFGDWGFDRKLSSGKGLSALFAGPSGTGKTMAAEIIAGELALDLYKVDLSNVVSKFIGETEKNLSKIFAEAETSNAILFFDEADALFGKRSEVKDSHDRYANIETGYLLQRMEEYEGVVILATNFRRNMDEAFVRRLHFTIEFPFPNETDRLRIWEVVWPEETPLDAGLDFDALARRFEITGGNVRNIALAAAFLAADDGQRVTMGHLMRATHRELQKMGKIVREGEFTPQTDVALEQ